MWALLANLVRKLSPRDRYAGGGGEPMSARFTTSLRLGCGQPGGLNSFNRVDSVVAAAANKMARALKRKLRVCERFSLAPKLEGRITIVGEEPREATTVAGQRGADIDASADAPDLAIVSGLAIPALSRGTSDGSTVPGSSPLVEHQLAGPRPETELVILHFNDMCVCWTAHIATCRVWHLRVVVGPCLRGVVVVAITT